ncbi:hypothetical protein MPRG_62110 (plasmid) [Mycobacterium paragordonae]|uniref:Uncharacterized protein n=1 Tax=Mycobacterium paragordonae TaxID=1389713 RepID=A0ABQ1CET2_9MYCO|nr:hypothetical protein MPRG_62110 [Mycobacterium paragordonae]
MADYDELATCEFGRADTERQAVLSHEPNREGTGLELPVTERPGPPLWVFRSFNLASGRAAAGDRTDLRRCG